MNEAIQGPPSEAAQAPLGAEDPSMTVHQQIQQQVSDNLDREARMEKMLQWSELQGRIAESAAAPYKDPVLNVDDESVSNLDIVASHVNEYGDYPSGKETIITEKTGPGIRTTAQVERDGDILVSIVNGPSRLTLTGGGTQDPLRLRSPKNIAYERAREREPVTRRPSLIRRALRRR